MKAEIIQAIKDTGLAVYMRNINDTYAYFTDGVHIGYIQEDKGFMEGISISTVHIPCHECGTGYNLEKHLEVKDLTEERLEHAFINAPSWATRSSYVKKWRNMEHFLTKDSWNAGFKEV